MAEPADPARPPHPADVADLVVEGCTVLAHDPDGTIRFLEDHAVVVRDGAVADVTPAARASALPARERIDARGQLAMPGLINCHTHTPMAALRGIAEDMPVEEWFNDWIWPIESNLTDEVVELGALLACAEMIRGGVTAFADHYFAMDRVADAVVRSGLRAVLGWTYFSGQGPEGRERSLDFALRRAGDADGRITTMLAPHAPYTVGDADLAATAELAREHGLPVHIHAAENRAQTDGSLERHGRTPVETLHRTGLLDVDLLVAHGTGLVGSDFEVLGRAAGRIGFATAPKGYLKFGWDTTPVRALRSLGIPVGLATDGAASNNTLDVWESMTLTALVSEVRGEGPAVADRAPGARPRDRPERTGDRARRAGGRPDTGPPRRPDPGGPHRTARPAAPRRRRGTGLQRALRGRADHDRRRPGPDAGPPAADARRRRRRDRTRAEAPRTDRPRTRAPYPGLRRRALSTRTPVDSSAPVHS